MQKSWINKLYKLQIENQLAAKNAPNMIVAPEIIDAWQHRRMHDFVMPLHRHFKDAEWLTIGDTGGDAFYLKTLGIKHVTSSCIESAHLLKLKKDKYLEGIEIREINAERIDMEDNSTDVVLCKESYHHFPRPPIGFY